MGRGVGAFPCGRGLSSVPMLCADALTPGEGIADGGRGGAIGRGGARGGAHPEGEQGASRGASSGKRGEGRGIPTPGEGRGIPTPIKRGREKWACYPALPLAKNSLGNLVWGY